MNYSTSLWQTPLGCIRTPPHSNLVLKAFAQTFYTLLVICYFKKKAPERQFFERNHNSLRGTSIRTEKEVTTYILFVRKSLQGSRE